ncbi:SDR family oxidoreductase [Streptomyces rochei]|uniref:SDR family oxidoreductase n=1 Tax=Streptomyces rochei TaxID=1928 RepID=UPI00402A638E
MTYPSTSGTPLLVTGGTGTLGRHVVPLLRAAGHEVRVLTRHPRPDADGVTHVTGDLLTGEGVEAAVAGAHTVLHLAGGPKGDDVATRALVGAARGADVRHLVYISVVGADRVPLAWLRTKLESERAVADSGIPWTALVRPYLALHGRRRRPHLPVRIPGKAGRAYREGANLTLEGAATGRLTWEEFLAERVAEKATEAPARS